MPMQSVIHKGYRLIVTTGAGRVTLDDVLSHQDRLLEDPDFNREFDQLVDCTGVTDVSLSEAEIRKAVRRDLFSPTSRLAIVVGSTFMYGMMRMTQTHSELAKVGSPMSIFRDRTAALKWLGVPENSELF